MTNETIFMNRELSWLKFNERVLEEAESEKNPLDVYKRQGYML